MAERRYSVAEIDQMRRSVAAILQWRAAPATIEEHLRTYMLNGTEPKELEAAEAQALGEMQERQRFGYSQADAERIALGR